MLPLLPAAPLPFHPEQWQNISNEYGKVRDCMLGRDITDYGLGAFNKMDVTLSIVDVVTLPSLQFLSALPPAVALTYPFWVCRFSTIAKTLSDAPNPSRY
ncbi:MAG: D-lyxose/D-mannose family sugar isomerase [Peptococcaceae bacterium]|nr:D-lyxose/D-mannose family sugar isomerase [Peptococcaceae bacterium]